MVDMIAMFAVGHPKRIEVPLGCHAVAGTVGSLMHMEAMRLAAGQ